MCVLCPNIVCTGEPGHKRSQGVFTKRRECLSSSVHPLLSLFFPLPLPPLLFPPCFPFFSCLRSFSCSFSKDYATMATGKHLFRNDCPLIPFWCGEHLSEVLYRTTLKWISTAMTNSQVIIIEEHVTLSLRECYISSKAVLIVFTVLICT